jgi:hypothetical protein
LFEPQYLKLMYNKYENQYYRIAKHPIDSKSKDGNRIEKMEWSIIVMNSEFEVINEVVFDYRYHSPELVLPSNNRGLYQQCRWSGYVGECNNDIIQVMKKTAIKLVVVSAFLLLSVNCMEEHERASSSFNSFLNIYGSEIADNYHLYLILPAFSCAGCVQIALQKANSSLSAEHKSYVTIIYQSNLVIPDELGQKAAVFRDSIQQA